MFNENHIKTKYDEIGYDDFLKKTKPIEKPKNIFKSEKVSNEKFNEAFDKYTRVNSSKHLVKLKEPEPILLGKKISFAELGVSDIDDFSGDNRTNKQLNFMDLKIAHTTSKLVDNSIVDKRQDFRNIDELQKARGNMSFELTKDDKKYYEEKKRLDEIKEKKRLQILQEEDRLASERYSKLQFLLRNQID
jgi:hypothetical protein